MAGEPPEIPSFHWADILVFVLYLCIIAGMGVFFGWRSRKRATTKEFLTGGGEMHWLSTGISMTSSFMSAVFILGVPAEYYFYGADFYYLSIAYLTALPISGYIYMPVFHRLGLTSAYQYLELRFNWSVRIAGSITFVVMTFLYLSVVLYAPAMALAQVTGLSMVGSIILTGLICVFYTSLGGMKATIWNDVFQMTIVFLMLVLLIVLGLIDGGGAANVREVCDEGGRLNWNSFDPDPTIRTSFWTQSVGGTFTYLAMYASNQTVAQKFISVSEVKHGQKALWVAAWGLVLFQTLTLIVGLVTYAYYAGCDPLAAGRIDKIDQILPLYVMEVFGHLHGLPGLFIAATFSAALSSVSGSLNALVAIFLVDFIKPSYKYITKGRQVTDKTGTIISRLLVVLFGLIVIGLSFMAELLGDMVTEIALGIFGFVGGPLTALISLGLFVPCCNWIGALSGLLVSLVITCWIAIGAMVHGTSTPFLDLSTDECYWLQDDGNTTAATYITTGPTYVEEVVLWVYELSHMYYGVVAMIVAFAVGVPVSFITGATNSKDLDPRLIYSCTDNCCCYCPQSCQTCCRCGVLYDHDDDDNDDDNKACDSESLSKEGLTGNGTNQIGFVKTVDECVVSELSAIKETGQLHKADTGIEHLNVTVQRSNPPDPERDSDSGTVNPGFGSTAL